jgi:hypothetical protein
MFWAVQHNWCFKETFERSPPKINMVVNNENSDLCYTHKTELLSEQHLYNPEEYHQHLNVGEKD